MGLKSRGFLELGQEIVEAILETVGIVFLKQLTKLENIKMTF